LSYKQVRDSVAPPINCYECSNVQSA